MKSLLRHAAFLPLLAIAVAALMIGVGAYQALHRPEAGMPSRTAVAASRLALLLPRVEPLVPLSDITPDQARLVNASVPFSTAPNPAARPFVFAGDALEKERALTCLASAVWYEAGDDPSGEQAVAQVVLNRVRHPAFPKSVCGVVFQGAERSVGCQFTFACDGALRRTPSADAWKRARGVAGNALSGSVFKQVGTVTHYHTDWVVPSWSATLEKVTEVHTHLFFRWKGWWGQPRAFAGRYRGPEIMDPRIVSLASAEARADTPLSPDGVPPASLNGNVVRLADASQAQYVLQLDTGAASGSYATAALNICKGKSVCAVMGWLNPSLMPKSLPVTPPKMQSVSFLFRRNEALKREQMLWNCIQIPRRDPSQCLPGTGPVVTTPPPPVVKTS